MTTEYNFCWRRPIFFFLKLFTLIKDPAVHVRVRWPLWKHTITQHAVNLPESTRAKRKGDGLSVSAWGPLPYCREMRKMEGMADEDLTLAAIAEKRENEVDGMRDHAAWLSYQSKVRKVDGTVSLCLAHTRSHTPSIAFRHLSSSSDATEEALFYLRAAVHRRAVSALRYRFGY